MPPVLYGIRNCDTVRKACRWLEENNINYEFSDLRQTLDQQRIQRWCRQFGLEQLINKRGTTYRKLSATEKAKLDSEKTAVPLILAQPTLIKRPVIEKDDRIIIGFDSKQYSQHL